MADDDLRELERTWRASGVLEDGVAWHRARLRAGAVDRETLRREAAEGDRSALVAADDLPPLLIQLDTWLRTHAPEVLASFNPPATKAEVEAAEEALGFPLPPLLRAAYRWRNGQAPQTGSDRRLPGFWRWLALGEIPSRPLRPLAGEFGWPSGSVPFMEDPHGALRVLTPAAEIWRAVPETPELRASPPAMWPGVQQAEGHLVLTGTWEVKHHVVAPSLEEWLNIVVAALEQGVWSFGQRDLAPLEYFSRAISPGYPQSYVGSQQIFASDLPSLDPILLQRRSSSGCELATLPVLFALWCLLAVSLSWGTWVGTLFLTLAGISLIGALGLVVGSRRSRAQAEARGEALGEAFAGASLTPADEA